jgi:hypothetical protein
LDALQEQVAEVFRTRVLPASYYAKSGEELYQPILGRRRVATPDVKHGAWVLKNSSRLANINIFGISDRSFRRCMRALSMAALAVAQGDKRTLEDSQPFFAVHSSSILSYARISTLFSNRVY